MLFCHFRLGLVVLALGLVSGEYLESIPDVAIFVSTSVDEREVL